jgi:hypothetical protein
MKFNAVRGIGLLCCSGVKVGNLIFARVLLAENPQSLAGDSVAFGRHAVSIAEDKYRAYGWLLCR